MIEDGHFCSRYCRRQALDKETQYTTEGRDILAAATGLVTMNQSRLTEERGLSLPRRAMARLIYQMGTMSEVHMSYER